MMPDEGWKWADDAVMNEMRPTRRVIGLHALRWDGLTDLILRARGASVFDVGCNRGHIAFDFEAHGARLCHGCDTYAAGIAAARHYFAEIPDVESKFEVVDLTGGPAAVTAAFGDMKYDIVLFIGVQHKLTRVMPERALLDLIEHLGDRAITYLGWNGYDYDVAQMDAALATVGLKRVHTSELAIAGRLAAIWRRR
jgi:SAM-dependent methyltransferase